MNARTIAIAVVVASGIIGSQAANAQYSHFNAGGVGFGYGGYGGGYSYHSSTVAEGYLRGLGAWAQGLGEYNYLTSLAGKNWQDARSMSLDNDRKYVETFYEKRRIHDEYISATNPPMSAQTRELIQKNNHPKRLTADEYEPTLGRLQWPLMLQGKEFAQMRKSVDDLFATRSPTNSGVGTKNCKAIQTVVASMQKKLDKQAKKVNTNDFIDANKFLKSLAYEARFAPNLDGVAVR